MKTAKKRRRRISAITPFAIIGIGFVLVAVVLFTLIGKGDSQDVSVSSRGASHPPGRGPMDSDDWTSVIPAEVEMETPDLILRTLDGEEQSLTDYLGKVVLLNNWATWCVPCIKEIPELQAFYDDHVDEGLVIIAIDAGDSASAVSQVVEENNVTFPVWLDPKKLSMNTFRMSSVPNSYVIDRAGVIRLAWIGVVRQEVLEEYVAPLLNESKDE